jgi:hypothetical protein
MKRTRRGVIPSVLVVILAACSARGSSIAELACGSWTVVKSPNGPSSNNQLYAVSASAANNVWAVGGYQSSNFGPFLTLTVRWNGSAWSVVPSPSPAPLYNSLGRMAAISASDVWAVGSQECIVGATLAEHWDGNSWSVVPTPNVGPGGNGLSDVFAPAGTDVWAVGSYANSSELTKTLIEKCDGALWSIAPSPNPSQEFNQLNGITGFSNTLLSVGYFGTLSVAKTLAEAFCEQPFD